MSHRPAQLARSLAPVASIRPTAGASPRAAAAMIEGVALACYVVAAYGAADALYYYVATAFIAWLLCGLFTRGRNGELEKIIREGASTPAPARRAAQDCCGAPRQDCCGAPRDGDAASRAAATMPGVRPSRSGGHLELCAELPRSVNPWVKSRRPRGNPTFFETTTPVRDSRVG